MKNRKGESYWFPYPMKSSVLKKNTTESAKLASSLHHFRDGGAALNISSILHNSFYWGGILFNLTPYTFFRRPPQFPKDYDFLDERDIIFQTTRIPLSDFEKHPLEKPKRNKPSSRILLKKVEKTFLHLEYFILQNCSQIFKKCCRMGVILNDQLLSHLDESDNRRLYRAVQFGLANDAFYCRKGDFDTFEALFKNVSSHSSYQLTIGYVLYIPNLYLSNDGKKGPKFLLSFGMNGVSTLHLSELLRKNSDWINEITNSNHPKLLMIEFSYGISPRYSHPYPAILSNCEVDLIKKINFDLLDWRPLNLETLLENYIIDINQELNYCIKEDVIKNIPLDVLKIIYPNFMSNET